MNHTVYVNGAFVPDSDAKISVFDRGYQFADSVYEVWGVLDGRLVDEHNHLERLFRSLGSLGITPPMTREQTQTVLREAAERNGVREGLVYAQISRGVARRNYLYDASLTPTVVIYALSETIRDDPLAHRGAKIVTVPEVRWLRRNVKTTALLAASMAKQAAIEAGFDDAWFIENGRVTEGTSNNAFILTDANEIVTAPTNQHILPGITRKAVLTLCENDGFVFLERSFTLDEAYGAKEAFSTSATTFVRPVVQIDDKPIGSGKPGPVALRLRALYLEAALA